MLSRQEVAFREECRKIKGCGSLREDFYTRFKPKMWIWGCDMAEKMNSISVVNDCCRSAILFKVGRKVNISSKMSMVSGEISNFRARSQMLSAKY